MQLSAGATSLTTSEQLSQYHAKAYFIGQILIQDCFLSTVSMPSTSRKGKVDAGMSVKVKE